MSSFSIVPNDILHCIFSLLPKKAIHSLLLTDKRISEFISTHQPLWQNLLPLHYPFHFPFPVSIPDASGTYKQIQAQEKNIRKKNKFRKDVFEGHTKAVTSLATQGTNLISGSHDKTIKVRDLKTGKERTIHVDHQIDCFAMHGNLLCSGSYDGGPIIVFNWKTREKLFTLEGHQDGVRGLAIHKGRLISCSPDKSIKIWDLESGKALHSWDKAHEKEVRAIFVQGDILYSSGNDGTLKAWDLNSKTELFNLNTLTGFDYGDWPNCIEVRGNTLFTGHDKGWVKIWDLTDRKLVKEWPAHRSTVKSFAVLGNILFSASYDNTVCGHDLENGDRVFLSLFLKGSVTSLSLQNGVLYSGSFDKTIINCDFNFPSRTPYDAKTLQETLSLLEHPEEALKLHPDFQERLRQHGFKLYGSFKITAEVIARVRTEVLLELLLDRLHAEDQKIVSEILRQLEKIDHDKENSLYWYLWDQIFSRYRGCPEAGEEAFHGSEYFTATLEQKEKAVFKFKQDLKVHWGPDLPLLLADLGIVTDKEFSLKLQCTPDHLGKVGIVSLADLQALGILCVPAIKHLELITVDQPKQIQLGEKRKQVLDILENLSAEIQKRRDESDHFGVVLFTDAEGQTIGDELSPWAVFQNQFNEIKAQLEAICSSPATLSKDNGELLEKTNALIDQFNAVEREYQITKLRAYIHQPHIRETWDALANLSLADYAKENPEAKLYQMGN
jgi:hypothetical protein